MITKPNKFLQRFALQQRRREAGYPKDARSRSVFMERKALFVQVMYD
ncbi:hypothetical protein HTT03_08140 [Sulfitobacter sp. S0837]|nr:hypothetical protein [Sulfitobacter maritimus]NUH63871.1 hypothetical protein [Sulfitobacter maritimus]NUH64889.1 hypothetical protein [Sulfitobacter maritimus]NUH65258.1 hypothetical protein [Sulfitobacter maritimus]